MGEGALPESRHQALNPENPRFLPAPSSALPRERPVASQGPPAGSASPGTPISGLREGKGASMASQQPPRGRGWGGGSGPCHSSGPGGGAGGQGGGRRQLWLRPDLGAERASARPARHSPSPPPTHPPGPEHGWAVSQRGWLGHGCARQTRTGGRVFQGGRPAPALLVSPPGPAGSSQLLSWPTRSGCLDGVLSAQTAGTGSGGSRVLRGQAGDPPTSRWSQQPLPALPHPTWDEDPEQGRLGGGTHGPQPGQLQPRPLRKGARGPRGWHHPAGSTQSQTPGPDQFQGFRHSGAPAGLSRRSVPGTS